MFLTADVRRTTLAVLLLAAGSANAVLTPRTTESAFAAAVSAPGVDSFASLSTTSTTASPLSRTAGAYAYVATAAGGFFGGGTTSDPFLAPDVPTASITFSNFTSTVRGFAGTFFASDIQGAYAAGAVSVTATDALGATLTVSLTPTSQTSGSFIGFTSNTSFTSVVVSVTQPAVGNIWASADNVTLALAVPEPSTLALLALGLATVGAAARRRINVSQE